MRITWPNRAVHFVVRFTSEKDAVGWIDAHAWLTKPIAEKTVDAAQHGERDLQQ